MVKTANIHAAKTQLSKLIEAALAGEEVIIQKAGKPAVRLAPITTVTKRREPGAWHGKVRMAPDFDEMPEAKAQ
ncbi:MAG: type II toxin-antitoxin system prevent-host-death family antitoxin [Alphaproteobacteria bacterium]